MFSLLDSEIHMDLGEVKRWSWWGRRERNQGRYWDRTYVVAEVAADRGYVEFTRKRPSTSKSLPRVWKNREIISSCQRKNYFIYFIYLTSPCNIISIRNRSHRQIPIKMINQSISCQKVLFFQHTWLACSTRQLYSHMQIILTRLIIIHKINHCNFWKYTPLIDCISRCEVIFSICS